MPIKQNTLFVISLFYISDSGGSSSGSDSDSDSNVRFADFDSKRTRSFIRKWQQPIYWPSYETPLLQPRPRTDYTIRLNKLPFRHFYLSFPFTKTFYLIVIIITHLKILTSMEVFFRQDFYPTLQVTMRNMVRQYDWVEVNFCIKKCHYLLCCHVHTILYHGRVVGHNAGGDNVTALLYFSTLCTCCILLARCFTSIRPVPDSGLQC